MNPCNASDQMSFMRVCLEALFVHSYCLLGLILSDSYLGYLEMQDQHILGLQSRLKLSLSILDHAHLKLAFPNSLLPPPVIVVYDSCRLGCDIQSPSEIRLHIDQIVNYSFRDVLLLCDIFGVKFVGHDKLASLLHEGSCSQTKNPPSRRHRPGRPGSLTLESSCQVGTTTPCYWAVRTRALKASDWSTSVRHGSHHLTYSSWLALG